MGTPSSGTACLWSKLQCIGFLAQDMCGPSKSKLSLVAGQAATRTTPMLPRLPRAAVHVEVSSSDGESCEEAPPKRPRSAADGASSGDGATTAVAVGPQHAFLELFSPPRVAPYVVMRGEGLI
eukprot:7438718-Alexandrium_andersonii.AAC.1